MRQSQSGEAEPNLAHESDELVAAYREQFSNYGPGHIALVPHWAPTEKALKAAVRAALTGSGRQWNFNCDSRGRLVVVFPDSAKPRAKTGCPTRVSKVTQAGAVESSRRRH